jgi:NAD(P)-dependent dehydrogenase (short-subunit alcohol dehydrogenase family)/catechol 2,3-dioxygenase-like lactoylglutathione lyase family enzyme
MEVYRMNVSRSQPTALITGASRGLGLALARELAWQGWALIIDARGATALEAARAELAQRTTVVAIPGDVTDTAHRAALSAAARETGGLDALVNNASFLGPSPQPPLLEYPLATLEQVFRTNVVAPLALLQAASPALKPGARILNITSDAGVEAYPGWGGYGASKAALEQLSAIFAAERSDLRVYWVDPGDMRTQMHQEAFPGEDISDRPLPEESVPGLLRLLTGDLPSGRYRAHDLKGAGAAAAAAEVSGLRVALTAEDFDGAVRLYRDGLGLAVVKQWDEPTGRGIILAAGEATLELLDQGDAALTDEVEVGRRVAGPVRLAFAVGDVVAVAAGLEAAGAQALHPPTPTSWSALSQRLQAPDGMQISLFRPNPTWEQPAESSAE